MANRRINPRHIKIHYSYTVKDAADALGTHKNTIRLWIKQGLALTDEQCPAMMLGTAIRAFLENRKAKRKRRLAAGEFYCLKCRAPKTPAGGGALSRLRNHHEQTNIIGEVGPHQRATGREDLRCHSHA